MSGHPDSTNEPYRSGVTLRAAGLSLALLCAIAYGLPVWLVWMNGEEILATDLSFAFYMPLLPFSAALILSALRGQHRIATLRLAPAEILTVFCILAIGTGAFQAAGSLVALLPTPAYYATPENDFVGHFLHTLPLHLVPFDPEMGGHVEDDLVGFYRGTRDGGGVPWGIWAGPLAWWGGLLAMVFGAQFCLGALVRKQWLEHEKLMFPQVGMVTSLVGEGLEDGRGLKHDRLFWVGVGVSAFVFILEGLNHYYPGVPNPGLTSMSMRPYLSEEPWLNMDKGMAVHPYLVAIAYMLTTEISLSIWVFAVVDNIFRALTSALVLPHPIGHAWIYYYGLNMGADTIGAVAVFVTGLAWTGRRHFRELWARATGKGRPEDDRSESLSYPGAFWGFWLFATGILAWCAAAGLSLWFCMLVWGIYALTVVWVSRLVAETGLLTATSGWVRPQLIAIRLVGFGGDASAIGNLSAGLRSPLLKSMAVLSYIWPTLMVGPHLMPMILTGLGAGESIAKRDRHARRRLMWLSIGGLAVATCIFVWRMLEEAYAGGALNSELPWFRRAGWIYGNSLIRDVLLKERSQTTDWTEVSFMGVGAGVMVLLLYLRRTFYWWPLHPIGYITTGIHSGLWFSFFLGWSVKRTVLKYGGGQGFKRLTGFFVGLFVGQFSAALLWYLVGALLGKAEVHSLMARSIS